MSHKAEAICQSCGKHTNGLLEFKKVLGVKPCVMVDEATGQSRNTLEPFFSPSKEVCYPCFVSESRAYVAETIGASA